MTRKIIGIIILVIGIAAFIGAAGSLPSGVNMNFTMGYFLPSLIIVAVGAIVTFWKSSNSKP